ncbi:MAG: adenylyltransferase/cytidyltransferase family protein [Candidatus Wildermuthbacteria bacterium]|nr:adenylyltransferase/cytidyltransferase family protein [Candidatus Wildermuthbacteria bacterium]
MKKRVVVFGIFDGVHEGHRALFLRAKEKGDELVVIVGRDAMCETLKGKTPRHSQEERVRLVQREQWVDGAVLGDMVQSSYAVLKELKPDVVCFGYDQLRLRDDFLSYLERNPLDVELYVLEPHQPHIFHNSILHRD